MFSNRVSAARKLAEKLISYRGRHPLVLAIPRGAVPMARVISEALEGDLDVALVHKLRAPGQPELAIGSVDETGQVYLNRYAREMGLSEEEIDREKRHQLEILKKRRRQYTPVHQPIDPAGRVVIVVDDGIATGSSMIAALRAVRFKHPEKLITAIPVAPQESLEAVGRLVDETVCLLVPEIFYSVGAFYESFDQVGDAEVVQILAMEGMA